MNSEITITEVEAMAKAANINGVEAFIREHGRDHDRSTIEVLKESLMAAVIAQGTGTDEEMDRFLFNRVKRVANL